MKQEFTRIAVKVGSNVLTRRDGTLDVTRMSALVDQIAELHKSGVEIILISSGAVASGRSEVHPQKKLDSVDHYTCRPGTDNEGKFWNSPPLSESEKLHDGNA